MRLTIKKTGLSLVLMIAGLLVVSGSFAQGDRDHRHDQDHPHYMRALSDLRAARWMLHNRPGNWQQTQDEMTAENEITAAIKEIIEASIDDGKNIDYHPPVDEKPGRVDRLMAAADFLNKAEQDLRQEEDNGFARGLRGRSLQHINVAKNAVNAAMHSNHPQYLRALSDLRAAYWMIHNIPGNWQQSNDEKAAENELIAAMNEIARACSVDGKNPDTNPGVDEKPGHADRLAAAMDYLNKANQDLSQDEDNAFASGLRGKSMQHINTAKNFINTAMHSNHPSYLRVISDLRAARYLLIHTPGDWRQTEDERFALREINASLDEIKQAAIDDGKNIDDHPQVDERPDRRGRLQVVMEFLRKANQDLSQEEDNAFANGLRARSQKHLDMAIKGIDKAMHS